MARLISLHSLNAMPSAEGREGTCAEREWVVDCWLVFLVILIGLVMLRSGLVSVTFRDLSPAEIVDLSARAEVDGIEWGGDLHVPHGDLKTARDVATMTREAGLEVAAYGSYYAVGKDEPTLFEKVLGCAIALRAPVIRVWPGKVASSEVDDATRAAITEDARRIASMAGRYGIRVATEWHGGNLTDTASSAERLFKEVDHPNFVTYWQTHRCMPFGKCLVDMETALPRLAGLHVFEWHVKSAEKLPLLAGSATWPTYLAKAVEAAGEDDMYAMIEFVRDGEPEQFLADAATLRRWVAAANGR